MSEGKIVEKKICSIFFEEYCKYLKSEEVQRICDSNKVEFDGSIEEIAEDEARKLFNSLIETTDDLSPFFIASLCEHFDPREQRDGLLSQWRGYGKRGGCCIVFDGDGLKNLIQTMAVREEFGNTIMKKVKYVSSDAEIDAGLFTGVGSDFAEAKLNAMLRGVSQEPKTSAQSLYNAVLETIPFYKDDAFKEENEVRIVVSAYAPGVGVQSSSMAKSQPKPFKFRESGGVLVPFVDLFSSKHCKLPIKEVIIGPGFDSDRRAAGVALLLKTLQINVPVRISGIPLTGT